MSANPFVSYAQTGEDVVLWRALGHVPGGTYVDVGAAHPTELSVTRALYERGWRGLNVEPVDAWFQLLRQDRPEDVNLQVLAGSQPGTAVLHEISGTGLSTVDPDIAARHHREGFASQPVERSVRRLDEMIDSELGSRPVHVLKIDVEGAETDVLAGLDLTRTRPWVILAEATDPLSSTTSHQQWEPALLEAEYRFCLFDGLSRFYVAQEHADELAARLSYPACPLDDFVRHDRVQAEERLEQSQTSLAAMEEEALVWRTEALVRAAEVSRLHRQPGNDIGAAAENELLHAEVAWLRGLNSDLEAQVQALGRSLSWRVTKPLRAGSALRRRVSGS